MLYNFFLFYVTGKLNDIFIKNSILFACVANKTAIHFFLFPVFQHHFQIIVLVYIFTYCTHWYVMWRYTYFLKLYLSVLDTHRQRHVISCNVHFNEIKVKGRCDCWSSCGHIRWVIVGLFFLISISNISTIYLFQCDQKFSGHVYKDLILSKYFKQT